MALAARPLGASSPSGIDCSSSSGHTAPWAFSTRCPMVPLSDATLGYSSRGTLQLRDVGTLIVNRDKLDWVRASEDEARAFPGVPVVTDRV